MSFQIGSQTAGVINNVEGDQTVSGVQIGQVGDDQARATAVQLWHAIRLAGLPDPVARQATAEAAALVDDIRRPQPDRPTVAGRLQRIVALVASVASLVTGGSAIAAAVQGLASWLGQLGAPILARLRTG